MTAINVDERKRWIGASEVSTLFGINKFQTREHLVQLKAGLIEPDDLSTKPAVQWGHRLEDIVLAHVETDFPAYTAGKKCEDYWPHGEVSQLGASPDSIGTWTGSDTPGVIEAKTTRSNRWFPRDGSIPEGWRLQVQTQLSCSDDHREDGEPIYEWGALVCLASGQDYCLWHIERDEEVIEQIKIEVPKFWLEVEAVLKEAKEAEQSAPEPVPNPFRATEEGSQAA